VGLQFEFKVQFTRVFQPKSGPKVTDDVSIIDNRKAAVTTVKSSLKA
jgi:hypothetical protein